MLAAVRIKLDATGGFEKVADQVSFRTTDDRWLDLLRLSVSSPEVTKGTPLAAHDLGEKAGAIALLAKQLEAQGDSHGDPVPLRQLLEALQLEPLADDAYRRLWFLQLHDRCRRFLHSSGRKIQGEEAFEKVNNHRNEIAHEGVERIDLQLMQQLQQLQMGALTGPNYGGYMTVGSKKYRGLYLHLCGLTEHEWSGSFSQIEQIIGSRLPPSARDHREWWSNHRGPGIQRQARSWIAAGWEVAGVDMANERISFRTGSVRAHQAPQRHGSGTR